MSTSNKKALLKLFAFIAGILVLILLVYAFIMYGGDREYRYETKYGDRFIVTKHAFFDGCELRVDEPGNDFYLDLDYFDPEESVTVKSESDQIIVYEICGIQFCKDLSSGAYQLYAGDRAG